MATKRDAVNGKKPAETALEKAQKAITKVRGFRGNVGVVDTSKYWQSIKESPVPSGGQHYHWNKSAEIYLNIGIASAEAFADLKK